MQDRMTYKSQVMNFNFNFTGQSRDREDYQSWLKDWESHLDYAFFCLHNKMQVIDIFIDVVKMKDKRIKELEELKCSKDLIKVSYQFQIKGLSEKIEILERHIKELEDARNS